MRCLKRDVKCYGELKDSLKFIQNTTSQCGRYSSILEDKYLDSRDPHQAVSVSSLIALADIWTRRATAIISLDKSYKNLVADCIYPCLHLIDILRLLILAYRLPVLLKYVAHLEDIFKFYSEFLFKIKLNQVNLSIENLGDSVSGLKMHLYDIHNLLAIRYITNWEKKHKKIMECLNKWSSSTDSKTIFGDISLKDIQEMIDDYNNISKVENIGKLHKNLIREPQSIIISKKLLDNIQEIKDQLIQTLNSKPININNLKSMVRYILNCLPKDNGIDIKPLVHTIRNFNKTESLLDEFVIMDIQDKDDANISNLDDISRKYIFPKFDKYICIRDTLNEWKSLVLNLYATIFHEESINKYYLNTVPNNAEINNTENKDQFSIDIDFNGADTNNKNVNSNIQLKNLIYFKYDICNITNIYLLIPSEMAKIKRCIGIYVEYPSFIDKIQNQEYKKKLQLIKKEFEIYNNWLIEIKQQVESKNIANILNMIDKTYNLRIKPTENDIVLIKTLLSDARDSLEQFDMSLSTPVNLMNDNIDEQLNASKYLNWKDYSLRQNLFESKQKYKNIVLNLITGILNDPLYIPLYNEHKYEVQLELLNSINCTDEIYKLGSFLWSFEKFIYNYSEISSNLSCSISPEELQSGDNIDYVRMNYFYDKILCRMASTSFLLIFCTQFSYIYSNSIIKGYVDTIMEYLNKKPTEYLLTKGELCNGLSLEMSKEYWCKIIQRLSSMHLLVIFTKKIKLEKISICTSELEKLYKNIKQTEVDGRCNEIWLLVTKYVCESFDTIECFKMWRNLRLMPSINSYSLIEPLDILYSELSRTLKMRSIEHIYSLCLSKTIYGNIKDYIEDLDLIISDEAICTELNDKTIVIKSLINEVQKWCEEALEVITQSIDSYSKADSRNDESISIYKYHVQNQTNVGYYKCCEINAHYPLSYNEYFISKAINDFPLRSLDISSINNNLPMSIYSDLALTNFSLVINNGNYCNKREDSVVKNHTILDGLLNHVLDKMKQLQMMRHKILMLIQKLRSITGEVEETSLCDISETLINQIKQIEGSNIYLYIDKILKTLGFLINDIQLEISITFLLLIWDYPDLENEILRTSDFWPDCRNMCNYHYLQNIISSIKKSPNFKGLLNSKLWSFNKNEILNRLRFIQAWIEEVSDLPLNSSFINPYKVLVLFSKYSKIIKTQVQMDNTCMICNISQIKFNETNYIHFPEIQLSISRLKLIEASKKILHFYNNIKEDICFFFSYIKNSINADLAKLVRDGIYSHTPTNSTKFLRFMPIEVIEALRRESKSHMNIRELQKDKYIEKYYRNSSVNCSLIEEMDLVYFSSSLCFVGLKFVQKVYKNCELETIDFTSWCNQIFLTSVISSSPIDAIKSTANLMYRQLISMFEESHRFEEYVVNDDTEFYYSKFPSLSNLSGWNINGVLIYILSYRVKLMECLSRAEYLPYGLVLELLDILDKIKDQLNYNGFLNREEFCKFSKVLYLEKSELCSANSCINIEEYYLLQNKLYTLKEFILNRESIGKEGVSIFLSDESYDISNCDDDNINTNYSLVGLKYQVESFNPLIDDILTKTKILHPLMENTLMYQEEINQWTYIAHTIIKDLEKRSEVKNSDSNDTEKSFILKKSKHNLQYPYWLPDKLNYPSLIYIIDNLLFYYSKYFIKIGFTNIDIIDYSNNLIQIKINLENIEKSINSILELANNPETENQIKEESKIKRESPIILDMDEIIKPPLLGENKIKQISNQIDYYSIENYPPPTPNVKKINELKVWIKKRDDLIVNILTKITKLHKLPKNNINSDKNNKEFRIDNTTNILNDNVKFLEYLKDLKEILSNNSEYMLNTKVFFKGYFAYFTGVVRYYFAYGTSNILGCRPNHFYEESEDNLEIKIGNSENFFKDEEKPIKRQKLQMQLSDNQVSQNNEFNISVTDNTKKNLTYNLYNSNKKIQLNFVPTIQYKDLIRLYRECNVWISNVDQSQELKKSIEYHLLESFINHGSKIINKITSFDDNKEVNTSIINYCLLHFIYPLIPIGQNESPKHCPCLALLDIRELLDDYNKILCEKLEFIMEEVIESNTANILKEFNISYKTYLVTLININIFTKYDGNLLYSIKNKNIKNGNNQYHKICHFNICSNVLYPDNNELNLSINIVELFRLLQNNTCNFSINISWPHIPLSLPLTIKSCIYYIRNYIKQIWEFLLFSYKIPELSINSINQYIKKIDHEIFTKSHSNEKFNNKNMSSIFAKYLDKSFNYHIKHLAKFAIMNYHKLINIHHFYNRDIIDSINQHKYLFINKWGYYEDHIKNIQSDNISEDEEYSVEQYQKDIQEQSSENLSNTNLLLQHPGFQVLNQISFIWLGWLSIYPPGKQHISKQYYEISNYEIPIGLFPIGNSNMTLSSEIINEIQKSYKLIYTNQVCNLSDLKLNKKSSFVLISAPWSKSKNIQDNQLNHLLSELVSLNSKGEKLKVIQFLSKYEYNTQNSDIIDDSYFKLWLLPSINLTTTFHTKKNPPISCYYMIGILEYIQSSCKDHYSNEHEELLYEMLPSVQQVYKIAKFYHDKLYKCETCLEFLLDTETPEFDKICNETIINNEFNTNQSYKSNLNTSEETVKTNFNMFSSAGTLLSSLLSISNVNKDHNDETFYDYSKNSEIFTLKQLATSLKKKAQNTSID
ncbi:uncharacterized protein CMU_021600 [Cryptosporidium muris RN66]|uniref:Uncharacterized protein n=1 Tax=Cryptosporidium muris (strain RN66) TaxID=441375 RepID=B6AJK5_CRYMR|nr:uncharacterized protein CMU_021600 [Cryptosporidium muris RN66]EEA08396.1 hypothetical protein CMU_021600 [Cryptosporidium muris RN66]|eukprot:XP_002142745.1 hypothetical protein [Cryptosporidium muris RN66]